MENLVYYNRLKHSKIVISDFHLAKLENGLIKDPCGTPEYLGEDIHKTLLSRQMSCDVTARNDDASCVVVQLQRWLADSGMAGLWTAGRQVSSCTYCK